MLSLWTTYLEFDVNKKRHVERFGNLLCSLDLNEEGQSILKFDTYQKQDVQPVARLSQRIFQKEAQKEPVFYNLPMFEAASTLNTQLTSYDMKITCWVDPRVLIVIAQDKTPMIMRVETAQGESPSQKYSLNHLVNGTVTFLPFQYSSIFGNHCEVIYQKPTNRATGLAKVFYLVRVKNNQDSPQSPGQPTVPVLKETWSVGLGMVTLHKDRTVKSHVVLTTSAINFTIWNDKRAFTLDYGGRIESFSATDQQTAQTKETQLMGNIFELSKKGREQKFKSIKWTAIAASSNNIILVSGHGQAYSLDGETKDNGCPDSANTGEGGLKSCRIYAALKMLGSSEDFRLELISHVIEDKMPPNNAEFSEVVRLKKSLFNSSRESKIHMQRVELVIACAQTRYFDLLVLDPQDYTSAKKRTSLKLKTELFIEEQSNCLIKLAMGLQVQPNGLSKECFIQMTRFWERSTILKSKERIFCCSDTSGSIVCS